MFRWRDDIRHYFNTDPLFKVYRESNRGEYRVLRCEFPHLLGWCMLKRPKGLPRSLKTPYFGGPYSPQVISKTRISRPHVNRLRLYRDTDEVHSTLLKVNIILNDQPLYKGQWGELRVGYWKTKNKEIIVRMYKKSLPHWRSLERKMLKEVCHVEETGHPNFLQYYGHVENKFWKYHLFEHMPQGNLLSLLKKDSDPWPEDIVRKVFAQIVYAISHLHDKDTVHRNLKVENILIGKEWEVRVIDITHTEKTTSQNRGDRDNISKTMYSNEYGPKLYRSPERVLGKGFNPLLDQVWGLGVMLYLMLFKKFPYTFSDDDEHGTIAAVVAGVKFVKGVPCPEDAKTLLRNIFQWESQRLRTFELFDDPWLSIYRDVSSMKRNNAIGRFSHDQAEEFRKDPKRLLLIRRKMFRHFKLFREDYFRQPTIQSVEMSELPGAMQNAGKVLGARPYGIYEVKENLHDLHKGERLYKEEYWPKLYKFNPIKCKYLGINRTYCRPRQYPVRANLLRLADKEVPAYGVPPPKNTGGEVQNDLKANNTLI